MKRNSTKLIAAIAISAALAASACGEDSTAEEGTDQTSELTDEEKKAVLAQAPPVDTSSGGAVTHSSTTDISTGSGCASCGPLPDPWKKTTAGPLPDPWKATSGGSGTGAGTTTAPQTSSGH